MVLIDVVGGVGLGVVGVQEDDEFYMDRMAGKGCECLERPGVSEQD